MRGSQICEVFEAKKGTGGIRRVLEQLQKSDLHVRESSTMEAKRKTMNANEKFDIARLVFAKF